MSHLNRGPEKGAATLVVTVVVLLVATIMVTFANRSMIYDLRSSANEARYKEAFMIAEAGLDFASSKFAANFRVTYDGTNATTQNTTLEAIRTASQVATPTKIDGTTTTAGSGTAYFTATITNTGSALNGIPIYAVVANGISADGTGNATIQRQFSMINALSGSIPSVPVVVGGAVGTGGNFNIVANPNGGDRPGIPVSVWSNGDISLSNSSATCHSQFYTGGQCPNPSGRVERISSGTGATLTNYNSLFPDLLPNDSHFPPDLFRFLFGVNRASWEAIKARAEEFNQVKSSCSDIVAAGASAGETYPIWWITGECRNTGVIGSTSKPVILVIDDNAFTSTGNNKINGIVYLFNNPSNTATPSAQMGGTTEIAGSFISDVGGSDMQGSYSVIYDPTLLLNFSKSGSSYSFSNVPHSWRDFQ